ncbi:hypothetical protein L1987_63389 [Smallanthus sonchifolius]|uniref:Uncharacterized protein n=1 Tax=Smallanthus sonchifolius TaxID=185202 RepID=A0ACB9CD54_9ASTR|nr:hypothetical protein L1987_63389 [Smallanthus sonchifolius]
MATDPQLLFDLFDTHWFSHQIFKTPPPQILKTEESVPQNLDHFSAVPTVNVRCYSDEFEELKGFMEAKEPVKKKKKNKGRRELVRSKSKSLSELEFEELKGFMDLGFLFSEKDKESSLVSIVPGLQRLGTDEKEQVDGYVNVSRPYLSEAWGDLEKTREVVPRLIRIPVVGDEADVKHQLKSWAHSVASVVS